jgi:hypothetical protein
MADLDSFLPVVVKQSHETIEMKLKWIQAAKQERISRIVHLRQSVEDLLKGKIPEIERQIMGAEQELVNLQETEKLLKVSIETEEVK